MATTAQMASTALFSSALNCFSLHGSGHGGHGGHGGPRHPMMDMVEGVLQERLDQWLANIFAEENPFFAPKMALVDRRGVPKRA